MFAAKFLIYWSLQAVWIYVTLLPVTVLNGTERNKGKPRSLLFVIQTVLLHGHDQADDPESVLC